MIVINIGLAMIQGAITEIDPTITKYGEFDATDSPYSNYVANNTLVVDDSYFPDSAETEADSKREHIYRYL